jgi:hypothetical protein
MKAFSFQHLRRGSGIASFGKHNLRRGSRVNDRTSYFRRDVRQITGDANNGNQYLKGAISANSVHIIGVGNVGRLLAHAIANGKKAQQDI